VRDAQFKDNNINIHARCVILILINNSRKNYSVQV
jgi:hypothetical protein